MSPREPRTILVADDEEMVRSFAAGILRREGFRLLEAIDGMDALDKVERLWPVDLLLTDVRMPRMDGIELARAIGKAHPQVPVIYISGYPFGSDPADSAAGSCVCLSKPFTRQALLDAVRKCLPPPGAAGDC